MTGLALILVFSSSILHATWNLFAKQAKGGIAFLWLIASFATLIYFPIAIFILLRNELSLNPVFFFLVLGSSAIHIGYFLLLQKGYQQGDLSIVYPIARGTGPILSTILAIILLGETPSFIAISGTFLIVVGLFIITGNFDFFKIPNLRYSLFMGGLTGISIAFYTIWDTYAVSVILIQPLLYHYCSEVGRVILLLPYAFKSWDKIRQEWRNKKKEVLVIATLSPLAYILVLTALAFTPVSYVAPMREVSILLVVLVGTIFLKEGQIARRCTAGLLIVSGVIALAFN